MKSILGLLLIAILATAVTANYDYNSKYIDNLLEDLRALKIHKAKVDFSDKQAEWEQIEDYQQAVVFEIKTSKRGLKETCGGRPTVVIGKGPIHCLMKMTFKAVNATGNETLKLGLVVENSKNHHDRKIILSDLFKAPQNKARDLADVVYVDPMTKEQVARVVFKKSFVGPVSWVKILLERGIYILKLESEKNSREVFIANPVVMDEEVLDKVLELLSKKTENDNKVETPQNDKDEMTDTISVKQLVNFWKNAENH